jgi:hypothetical protein
VTDLCTWLDCPPSSYYASWLKADESEVVQAMEQILLRFPFYGYRKVHKALVRQGIAIGEHRVR